MWQYVHPSRFNQYVTDNVLRAYRNLSPRTRLMIGGGVMLYAGFGLFLSDKAEQTFGFTPSEEDKRKLREAVPKIHVVDKD